MTRIVACECVIHFISPPCLSGPSVRRYRMDGYTPSLVKALSNDEQVLTGEGVEAMDGSLTVRFRRPFLSPLTGPHDETATAGSWSSCGPDRGGVVDACGFASRSPPLPGATDAWVTRDESCRLGGPCGPANAGDDTVPVDSRKGSDVGSDPVGEEDMSCADRGGDGQFPWMDPRDEGVVVIWAYGSGGWPTYHDATGSFSLPLLGDGPPS